MYNMAMKAIVYEKYGPPEVLKSIETQKPIPKSNELLIKVKAIALNPLDYRIRRGWIRPLTDFNFPRSIGSDFSGEVVEVGDKVSSFHQAYKWKIPQRFRQMNILFLAKKSVCRLLNIWVKMNWV